MKKGERSRTCTIKSPNKERIEVDAFISEEAAGYLAKLKLKGIKKGEVIELSIELLANEIRIKGLDKALEELLEGET